MFLVGLVSWWYTTGWITLLRKTGERIQATIDFFSMRLLLSSLFSPFRQIAAGRVQGPLNVQLQALGDQLFSRFVGVMVRLMVITLGLIVVFVLATMCGAFIIAWPVLPFAPLLGLLFIGVVI